MFDILVHGMKANQLISLLIPLSVTTWFWYILASLNREVLYKTYYDPSGVKLGKQTISYFFPMQVILI